MLEAVPNKIAAVRSSKTSKTCQELCPIGTDGESERERERERERKRERKREESYTY